MNNYRVYASLAHRDHVAIFFMEAINVNAQHVSENVQVNQRSNYNRIIKLGCK